jgi:hypothetical protein
MFPKDKYRSAIQFVVFFTKQIWEGDINWERKVKWSECIKKVNFSLPIPLTPVEGSGNTSPLILNVGCV